MIHQFVTARTLGFVRVWVFSIWLLTILMDPFHELADLPVFIFEPIGVLQILPASAWHWLLKASSLWAFKLIVLVLLVLTLVGIKPYRAVAIATATLLTIHQALVRSFGYINHAELVLLYAAYVLVLFPAADGFSWPNRRSERTPQPVYSAALLLMAALLLFTYTAIGSFRIAQSGPEIFPGDSMRYYIGFMTLRDSYYGFTLGRWVLEIPALGWLVNSGFAVVTAFEVPALLCLVSRKFRYAWFVVIIPFHFVTLITMNIFFWENLLLFPVLLVDINRWISPPPIDPTLTSELAQEA